MYCDKLLCVLVGLFTLVSINILQETKTYFRKVDAMKYTSIDVKSSSGSDVELLQCHVGEYSAPKQMLSRSYLIGS